MRHALFQVCALVGGSNTRAYAQHQQGQGAINATGASFSSTMQWTSLYKVRERSNWFLLYTNKQVAMLIPKTAFTSSDDMEVFRKMTSVVGNK